MGRRTVEPPISWLMHAALSRPELISLAAGFTDNASLPVAEARAALNQVLGSPKTGQPALQYGSTAGDPALRKLTAEYLRKLDLGGTPCRRPQNQGRRHAIPPETYSPERLLITSGSQHPGGWLALTLVTNRHRTAAGSRSHWLLRPGACSRGGR